MDNPKVILKQQILTGINYISQLLDSLKDTPELVLYTPTDGSRKMGDILLHILRALEYYLVGVTSDSWIPLKYSLETYDSFKKITQLLESRQDDYTGMIEKIDGDNLHHKYTTLQSQAFGLNLIIELLYHQSHHFGQLQMYLRLNGINPPHYEFLV